MKTSKIRHRRETSNANLQSLSPTLRGPWSLKFGTSLEVGGWFLLFFLTVHAHPQSYTVDWSKISGGGGTSSGGVYSVTGAIGQPDAGVPMSGGNFSVSGGYWSLIAVVQTAGSPTLTLSHSGAGVMISWPSSSTGFVLQQNSDLATANWSTSGFTLSDDGTTKSITITSPTGNLFFRLKK